MALGITSVSTKYVMVGGKCIMRITASWALETTGLYAIGLCEFEGGKYVCNLAYSDQIIAGVGDPKSGTMSLRDITLGARWNTGDKIDVSLVKQPYDPLNIIGTQKTITVGACEVPCPDPTVAITSVSDRYPKSGETVDFTGYASGGTGHSIVSKKWDFGDGTSSTELNPSKAWTNNTGSSIKYTVKFTATNDCGKSKSSTTTVTVSPAEVKNGIEIQFPSSLNGKQLIAHGAISTVLNLWWTGPAVHGILWTKGRVTWNNIDSSKKYVIQTGDACETSLPRESPDLCAGTFEDGDDVVILVRNPGIDFRVYGSGNVHKLSGTSFGVLYLDTTSGDIITTAFTGKVCGWLGIPSGTECDAFWAEFYDPIFVANYMSIMSTGKDMFGNTRTLSWIDHVAFVAAIVGSLPVLNIIPVGAVVTRIGDATRVIARATLALGVDDALKAGKTLVDVCKNAPEVVCRMTKAELDELRTALVKVYGDVIGNGYVDDALTFAGQFARRNSKILVEYNNGLVKSIRRHHIEDMVAHGIDNPGEIVDLIDSVNDTGDQLFPVINRVIARLKTGGPWYDPISYQQPLGNLLEMVTKNRPHVTDAKLNNLIKETSRVQTKAMGTADPGATSAIAQEVFDITDNKKKIIDDKCGVRP